MNEEPSVRAGEPFTTEIESERMPEEFRQVPCDRSAPNPSVDGFDYREPPTIRGDPEGSGRGDPGAPGVNPKNRAKRRRRSWAYHRCRAWSLVRRLLVPSIVVVSAVVPLRQLRDVQSLPRRRFRPCTKVEKGWGRHFLPAMRSGQCPLPVPHSSWEGQVDNKTR